MDISGFLERLQTAPEYADQMVHLEAIAPREARYADLARPLQPALQDTLSQQGIDSLYEHQATAIDTLASGSHVVVATGAASGKSLCYQLPILDALLRDRTGRSLLLFPTKALAQDQLRSMRGLTQSGVTARVDIFDGDTQGGTPSDQTVRPGGNNQP